MAHCLISRKEIHDLTIYQVSDYVELCIARPPNLKSAQMSDAWYRSIDADIALLAISLVCYAATLVIRHRSGGLWFFKTVETGSGCEQNMQFILTASNYIVTSPPCSEHRYHVFCVVNWKRHHQHSCSFSHASGLQRDYSSGRLYLATASSVAPHYIRRDIRATRYQRLPLHDAGWNEYSSSTRVED